MSSLSISKWLPLGLMYALHDTQSPSRSFGISVVLVVTQLHLRFAVGAFDVAPVVAPALRDIEFSPQCGQVNVTDTGFTSMWKPTALLMAAPPFSAVF